MPLTVRRSWCLNDVLQYKVDPFICNNSRQKTALVFIYLWRNEASTKPGSSIKHVRVLSVVFANRVEVSSEHNKRYETNEDKYGQQAEPCQRHAEYVT